MGRPKRRSAACKVAGVPKLGGEEMNKVRLLFLLVTPLVGIHLGPCYVHAAEAGRVLALLDAGLAMPVARSDDVPAFPISDGDFLVSLDDEALGELAGRAGVTVLLRAPDLPLWITPGQIPDDLVPRSGIRVVLRTPVSTIYAARSDDAYGLSAHGYFPVRIRFRPLSRLLAPPKGEHLLADLVEARPLTEARVRCMMGVAGPVDTNSVFDTIYHLNYDESQGRFRSRFVVRPELEAETVPYLVARLGSYLTPYGGEVETSRFQFPLPAQYKPADTVTAWTSLNILGRKPGRSTSAYYVICAHYDAIAVRDPMWDWKADPAPGADDNATGVAAVLECARLVSGLDLDFSLLFVLFSAEELGLLGSEAYVDSLAEADTVLGVINFDMVGYGAPGKYIEVSYDWKSGWLAGLLEEAHDAVGVPAQLIDLDRTGIYNSDHGSFWRAGIPGVMLADLTDGGVPVYHYYHTRGDTLGNLDIGLVVDNIRLVSAHVARFATGPEDTLGDIHLTASSVEWDWEGRDRGRALVASETVEAKLRAINVGGPMLDEAAYDLEIWEGDPQTGRLVWQGTSILGLLAGEYTDIRASLETDGRSYGYVYYTFSLLPGAGVEEADLNDNTAKVALLVMPQAAVLSDLHVYPNPVEGPGDARLAFDIYHPDGDFDGFLDVWVYDMLGRKIGSGRLERTHTIQDMQIGKNVLNLSRFLTDGTDLAPGLYLCVADLRIIGSPAALHSTFRFAVAR
jgi:hypothetical protein